MKEILNVTVILPVHKLDDETKVYFANAVKSVEIQTTLPSELLIVVPSGSDVLDFLKTFDFGEIKDIVKIVENSGETDFCSQVNLAVTEASGEWISFLELDDEYSNIWFKNVKLYMDAYPAVELFMPIVVDVDVNGGFLSFTNEAVWASGFSDEMGSLDINALLAYQNFSIDGIVIKKSAIDDFGGFKPSIKLTFIYEFLLRMVFKDVKTLTIPKFGYKHVNQRPDSLFFNYRNEMDAIESKFWLAQSKKEYFFQKDRKITYATQVS